jgi:hypothetical protein
MIGDRLDNRQFLYTQLVAIPTGDKVGHATSRELEQWSIVAQPSPYVFTIRKGCSATIINSILLVHCAIHFYFSVISYLDFP